MLYSMYINVLVLSIVSNEDDNITIATNSICHRRTKGTYPDYNCSDDNARFIALFTHVRNHRKLLFAISHILSLYCYYYLFYFFVVNLITTDSD